MKRSPANHGVEAAALEGDYEYRDTCADTGTLTLTVDILPIPQVADLTFDSRTTGNFAAGTGGVVVCEGRFEFVDTTMADTTPPALVGAEVTAGGDEVTLVFDEDLAEVDYRASSPGVRRSWSPTPNLTPGDDDVALQDLAGNDMASFTETAANNSAVEPVPVLPVVGLGLLSLLLVLLGRRRQSRLSPAPRSGFRA